MRNLVPNFKILPHESPLNMHKIGIWGWGKMGKAGVGPPPLYSQLCQIQYFVQKFLNFLWTWPFLPIIATSNCSKANLHAKISNIFACGGHLLDQWKVKLTPLPLKPCSYIHFKTTTRICLYYQIAPRPFYMKTWRNPQNFRLRRAFTRSVKHKIYASAIRTLF